MKKADIIDLTLKILGIYLIVSIFLGLKDLYVYSSFYSQSDFHTNQKDIIIYIAIIAGISLIIFIAGYFLIFKSHRIAKFIIKDDSEFQISFDKNYQGVLQIALIIIALFIIILKITVVVSSVVRLLQYLFTNDKFHSEFLISDIVVTIHYILAFFILFNAKGLTNWIIRINKKNLTPEGKIDI